MSERSPGRPSFFSRLWRLLSSPRFALVIILVLVALCLIGVFLMQAPSEITTDPATYRLWVDNMARPRFGGWTGLFSALRLFDVFHSPWFIAAGSLLMINILFCTVKRWSSVVIAVRGGGVKQAASFYRTGTDRAQATVPALSGKSGEAMADILKSRRYRVKAESADGFINMAAGKNRFSPLGTFLTHLSLILFVLGFLVTAVWGFRHAAFLVAEGSREDVGHGTGLSLMLKSFEDEYWPDGRPKDFRSEVVLYSEGREVAPALVRVNSPLSYHGVNFYQASFGTALRLQVRAAGEDVYNGSFPLTQTVSMEGVVRYAGKLELPEAGITVLLLSQAFNGADPVIRDNEVGALVYRDGTADPVASELLEAGVPRDIVGLQFTLVGREQFSVFQISYNPGIVLVWIACGFFILGLGLVFYLPYRQLWVLVEPFDKQSSRLTVRASGRSSPGLDEIKTLLQQVNSKLR